MAEVDINEEEKAFRAFAFGDADPTVNPEDWEVYRTDVDLEARVFLNPACWLTFGVYWDSLIGYGFRIGPVHLAIVITKYIRQKNEQHEK